MSSIDSAVFAPSLEDCAAGSDLLLALCRDFFAGRMAHATLLTGESGIGKKTLARLLAQGLLCSGEGKKPCMQCRDCRRFLARTHPDAFFPEPAPREKTIKIDALREMIDALSHHSLEGGRRVILIENAERMTPQAQNCLLKTLEEADGGVYFLLTADVEAALLPTIRSRCRVIRMQPWPDERIEQALLNRGIAPERARSIARCCDGSLGRALQMQEDEGYWNARDLVRRSFLSIQSTADIAVASLLLKDQKDQGDQLLDILEQQIRALLHCLLSGAAFPADDFSAFWQHATPRGLRVILEGILLSRRHRAANVGWAALAEGLMQTISEETSKWQA